MYTFVIRKKLRVFIYTSGGFLFPFLKKGFEPRILKL